jgi:hypothetical protein
MTQAAERYGPGSPPLGNAANLLGLHKTLLEITSTAGWMIGSLPYAWYHPKPRSGNGLLDVALAPGLASSRGPSARYRVPKALARGVRREAGVWPALSQTKAPQAPYL